MGKVYRLSELTPATVERFSSGYDELDVQFGGGIPRRKLSVWPAAGGTGKSRLWVQVTKGLNSEEAVFPRRVLYITGENPPAEFAGEKFGGYRSDNYFIARLFSIGEIVDAILQTRPDLVVLDSVNSIVEFRGGRGARDIVEGFERDNGGRQMGLRAAAEQTNSHIVLLSQQNADGSAKGGTSLGHWVDIEVYLSKVKDDNNRFVVRFGKNRYGRSGTESYWLHTDEGVEPTTLPSDKAEELESVYHPYHQGVMSKVGEFIWRALSTPIR